LIYLAPQRGEHGEILSPVIMVGKPMSGLKLFRYKFSLLGIRDPETVAELWEKEKARRPKRKKG
jgi:hypothetical protein